MIFGDSLWIYWGVLRYNNHMKKNVYLPAWQKRFVPPLFVAIWLFVTYKQFFAGAPEMGTAEYLFFTLVFVGSGSVVWLMASGKLPAYVIEDGEGSAPKTVVYAKEPNAEKEARKARVLALITERGQVQNNDVEALLGVSDASAERYLHELEQEGHIRQHGTTGKDVFYTIR